MSPKRVYRWWQGLQHRKALAGFLILAAGLVYAIHTQSVQTSQRVAEIQHSRIVSCRQTYEGVRQVFLPFFPPRKDRTKDQRYLVRKLNTTVDRLKDRCRQQTTPN